MTDRTDPEALRLAEILEGDYCPDWFYEQGVDEVAAELRRQHARIAELEAQLEAVGAGGVSGPMMGQPQAMPDLSALTERGAKAWAGVDAQGLRDGVASAGSEPVAWKHDCAALLANDVELWIDACPHCGKPRMHATQAAHPPPPEGMVGGWQDIATAPKDGTYLLLWEQYSANPFVGCWAFGSWSVSHEHVDAEGGWDGAIVVDSISQDRITHWMPLPPPPTSSADSGKGE